MHADTIAIHGGCSADRNAHAVAVPIYQTVSYAFDSTEHAAALFNLEVEGHRYSRISNPTTAVLDKRLAMLEGGVDAVSVSSGQSALYYALLNLARPGTNIVATPHLYGTTHSLLTHLLPSIGIAARIASSEDPAAVAGLVNEDTSAVFCESIGNPSGTVADIESLASVAHDNGVPLIVDNTIATPFLLKPIEFGADIVVHSLTKFLGGHGAALGGAIIDSGRFDWANHRQRFPMFSDPDPSYHGLVYTEHFGAAAYLGRCRSVFLRVTGAALSPNSAFLLLLGIETASVRIDRHVENGLQVARYLRDDRRVSWVSYPGFADNPHHLMLRKYLQGRAPSVFTFGLVGGYDAATRFYDSLSLVKRVVNLGDVRSLACHPASTTHRQMSTAQQRAAGILPETIRISVGIENVDDIIADIDQALAVAAGSRVGQPDMALS